MICTDRNHIFPAANAIIPILFRYVCIILIMAILLTAPTGNYCHEYDVNCALSVSTAGGAERDV